MANSNRKLWVPIAPTKTTKFAGTGPDFINMQLNPNHVKTAIMVDKVIDSIAPGYKDAAVQKGINLVKNAGGKINGGNSNSGSNSGNNKKSGNSMGFMTVFSGRKGNSTSNESYALSKAPNPKSVRLNSGIKPNTFVNDYMTPVENQCVPMHMAGISLRIPVITTNPLYGYFINTICFDIQTRAQANVGFSLDLTTLSASNLLTAFNAAIYALQVYFHYSSILSYESDSKNKNSGMINLRGSVSSTIMSELTQLGKRLEDTPIPPRLVEWVRFMCGNYYSSDSQGSPLLKICPHSNMYNGPATGVTATSLALDGLNFAGNANVFTLLRRAIPKWRVGTLYDVPPTPVYDENFSTIFCNLPCQQFTGATLYRTGSVANTTTSIPYNSYNNNLDGLAFAMGYTFNSAINDYIALHNPTSVDLTNYKDNRISYYTVGGVSAWYTVNAYSFLSLSRQETSTYNGAVNSTPHLYGTDRCQNVTGGALLQSQQSTLDFLFNTDAIVSKGTVKHYS